MTEITTTHVVRWFRGIDAVAEAWEQLADELDAPPFLRPGWTRAWLSAFTSQGFTLCTVWRDGYLVALAPLLMRRRSIASATNVHSPLWDLLAVDQASLEALGDALVKDRPYRVTFDWFDVESTTASAFTRTMRRMGYRQRIDERMLSPFSDVQATWDEFEQRLSRRRRSQLRRYARRLGEQGKVQFEMADGRSDLESLLAEGYRVEGSGWKGREGTAIESKTSTRQFYTDVARWAADRGWLRLTYLQLDDRTIAFEYLLWCGETVYYVKAGYDETYGKWSPSTLLMQHTLRAVVSDATRYFEWLGHDDAYKLEWSDGIHERSRVTWFAPTPLGAAGYVVSSFARWASAGARRFALALLSPAAQRRVKTVRSVISRLLRRSDG